MRPGRHSPQCYQGRRPAVQHRRDALVEATDPIQEQNEPMASVAALQKQLAELPADREVSATLLLSSLPRHIELSYVEAALSQ